MRHWECKWMDKVMDTAGNHQLVFIEPVWRVILSWAFTIYFVSSLLPQAWGRYSVESSDSDSLFCPHGKLLFTWKTFQVYYCMFFMCFTCTTQDLIIKTLAIFPSSFTQLLKEKTCKHFLMSTAIPVPGR